MAHSQIAKKTKQSEEYGEYEKLSADLKLLISSF